MNTESIGLNKTFDSIKEFQLAFGHPTSEKPIFMNIERACSRVDWMREEVNEFVDASFNYDMVGQADAMIDLIYFAVGTLVEMGIKPQPLFDIVQKANMAKLWEDGKPRYREDGKIKKPDTWVAPEPMLKAEIQRQIDLSEDKKGEDN